MRPWFIAGFIVLFCLLPNLWLGDRTSNATIARLSTLNVLQLTSAREEREKQVEEKSKHRFPKTASEYAKMVESELGVPPHVDLDTAVEIPIYVDGVQSYGNLGTACDNPTRLGKSTYSGCVIQRYEGRDAKNEPLPDVVWVAFGRNSTDNPKRIIGSVQMIGYNKKTGATAFFESSDRLSPWVTIDEKTLRMRGKMPWIDNPREFNRAFVPPGNTQCVECHQADPFITNTFINAAKIPGTDKPVIPILDADAPYFVIGGENWDMRTMHIQGNACFDCHRIGQSTLKLFLNAGWNPNDHMPPDDPGSMPKDLEQVLEVLASGPEKVADAEWVIPPIGEGKNKVVADDYLHKASFNRPRKSEKESRSKFARDSGQDKAFPKRFATPSKTEATEIQSLLKRLKDTDTRNAFEEWFKANGADPEALEKLRSRVGGKQW